MASTMAVRRMTSPWKIPTPSVFSVFGTPEKIASTEIRYTGSMDNIKVKEGDVVYNDATGRTVEVVGVATTQGSVAPNVVVYRIGDGHGFDERLYVMSHEKFLRDHSRACPKCGRAGSELNGLQPGNVYEMHSARYKLLYSAYDCDRDTGVVMYSAEMDPDTNYVCTRESFLKQFKPVLCSCGRRVNQYT